MIRILMSSLLLSLLTLPAVAQDSSEFAFDLYRNIAKTEGNLFFSPFSISSALTMTAAGAKNTTFKEMEKVLRLSKDPHGYYIGLLPKLKSPDYEFLVANRLWGQSGEEYQPDFLKRLTDNYSSDLVSLDFKNKPEASRTEINKWVQEKTQNKIVDLIPQGGISTDTNLIITNAVYFKGMWVAPFDPGSTGNRIFKEDLGVVHSIPFMNQTENFYFAKNKQAKMVLLPYQGQDLSMVIILPEPQIKIATFESTLNSKSFNSLFNSGAQTKVRLSIPKFKSEFSNELSETLKKMGMNEAFDSKKANFEGIRKPNPNGEKLFISKVMHKAFIETDEKGTTAAAATAVMAEVGAAMPKPEKIEEFIADRPFIYLIRHQSSGAILFMGRFSKHSN